ncbi:hypothetical protein SARC_06968 [Sphaeroforma arctica JP610]|uniref:Uncharacterized protein n=1 Tax=Sphaeroforma arctica JP610 TaxID=667725 RepID=A0A0L0FVL5_9EUKA|nr:hypothetical protein SARC_06968 [Sphaeroforma arctica JP610]KNC80679.1 hypothetical protein SARC_06968 [Sphaeroforma arctica JP610]|eukprot:XP_014154581.1 hypothetical protein SARC_06968 [Sphaeroforma arctica JP610]
MPEGWIAPMATSTLFGGAEPATGRVLVMSSDAYMGLTLVIITVCIDFLLADLLLLSAFHTSVLALFPALAHTVLSISASSVLLAIVLGVIPLTVDQLWYQSWVYMLCDVNWSISLLLMGLTMLGVLVDEEVEEAADKQTESGKVKDLSAPPNSAPRCIKKGSGGAPGRLRGGEKPRGRTGKAVKETNIICEKDKAAMKLRGKKSGTTGKCASLISEKEKAEILLRDIKRDANRGSAGSCPTILSEKEKAEIDLRVNKYVAERVAQMRAEISRQRDERARQCAAGLDSTINSSAG